MSLEINRAGLFGCWLHFSFRGLLYRLRSSFGSLCARSSHCKPGPRSLKAASQPDELTGYCFKAFDVALLSPGKMTRKTTFDLPHDLLQHAKHEADERNMTLLAPVILTLRKELGSHGYVRMREPTLSEWVSGNFFFRPERNKPNSYFSYKAMERE
jgi:hypothetical protein